MNPLFKALALCVQAHHNQLDRANKPYALHCIRVAEQQTTEERMIVAFLHDVIEDCEITEADLEREFGPEIARKVALLSRGKDQPYEEYIQQVCRDTDCMYVKLSDLHDNTRVDRVDLKAAAKMPRYKKAYDTIITRLAKLSAS